jgi:hypothetical protein
VLRLGAFCLAKLPTANFFGTAVRDWLFFRVFAIAVLGRGASRQLKSAAGLSIARSASFLPGDAMHRELPSSDSATELDAALADYMRRMDAGEQVELEQLVKHLRI